MPDCVTVRVRYRLTEHLRADEYDVTLGVLTPDERARHDRLFFDRDRRDFAAAHALLHSMLRDEGFDLRDGWHFVRSEHGKPRLEPLAGGPPCPVSFNLAHTRGLVACAIAKADTGSAPDIGVDVEPIRAKDSGRDIARRFFCPGELSALDGCEPQEQRAIRFTELWTLKEAYIKAIGLGLACPLHSFAFGFLGGDRLQFERPEGAVSGEWSFWLYEPASGYRLAVAAPPGASIRTTGVGEDEELRPLRCA